MESYSWQGLAIRALQEVSQYMLVGLLEYANLCTIHMKHVMILPQDLQLPCMCEDTHSSSEGVKQR